MRESAGIPENAVPLDSRGEIKYDLWIVWLGCEILLNGGVSTAQKNFGRNLGRLRHGKGLTQMELAERAEISHRYLQSLEAGRKLASIEVAGRLRAALGCSWDELMKGV